jgi:hypothetical protein
VKRCCAKTILAGALVATAFALPSHVSGDPRSAQVERPGWILFGGRWTKPSADMRWADFVEFQQRGTHVSLAWHTQTPAAMAIRLGRLALVRFENSPFLWTAESTVSPLATGNESRKQHAFIARVFGTSIELDATPRLQSITVADSSAELVGRYVSPTGGVRLVQLTIARAGPLRVYVGDERNGMLVDVLNVEAQSLFEVLLSDRAVVREAVLPLLDELAGERLMWLPGADDAYRAFPQIVASELETAALNETLALARSESADDRARLAQSLRDLGHAGVLAAQSVDRSRLDAAQRQAIDELIESSSHYAGATGENLRNHQGFLEDCLSFPDPRVAEAARQQLAERFGAK